MSDHDLPDPAPRPKLSGAEYLDHRWKLFRALFVFSVVYGALHKVFIPLFLSSTTVLIRDYTEIDLWAIPGLVLAVQLFRRNELGAWGSFLAGSLIAYAVADARAIAMGEYKGWLIWSHALSSLPQGLMAIVLLSAEGRRRSLRGAWSGALAVLVLFVLVSFVSTPETKSGGTQVLAFKSLEFLGPEACGAQAFRVRSSEVKIHSKLELKACGFVPASLRLPKGKIIQLDRVESETINIHVVFYDAAGRRVRQSNRVLRPSEQKLNLSELVFGADEVAAVLFSDARPHIGKVLILPAKREEESGVIGVHLDRRLEFGSL